MAQRGATHEERVFSALQSFSAKNEKYRGSSWGRYGVDIVVVLEEFGRMFNLAAPRSKGKRGYWVKTARDMLLELGSSARVVERMQWLVDQQKAGQRRFDVYSPKSIFTVITAVPLDQAGKGQGLRKAVQRYLDQGLHDVEIVEKYVNMKARSGQDEETSRLEISAILAELKEEVFDYDNW